MYAIHNCQSAVESCLALCRGSYQEAIIRGSEAMSGATLKGRAKSYASRYKASANRIVARCRAAGIAITEIRADHNRRVLVIG